MKTLAAIAFAAGVAAAALEGQPPDARQPQVENARLESRAFAGSLATQVSSFGAGPFWTAWQEPIIPGRRGDMCWNRGNGDGPDNDGHAVGAPVRLEGPTALVVLVRIENSQLSQLRVASPDCRFDGGALPFYWINGVPAAESIAWLRAQLADSHADAAISAIAMHSGQVADRALDELIAADQPERVREKTAFWLGTTRGAPGVDLLKRVLANDKSEKLREQVVFALSQSKERAGMAAVLDTARNDKDPRIRSRALFWIAQRAASQQARDAINGAIENDPERSVKEQAVFALKQLPEDQGVPLLINVAKNNPDPAVRKKAIFWLGQSKDPRALEFFAQILK
jgi:hypothetical protein